MSIMVGVGKGAQHGVLVRDAEALERMEKVDTLVLDKTGTLTEGRPKVVHVEPTEGFSKDDVLQKLASVERASEHPLALAIVNAAQEGKLNLSAVTDFDSPVGKGVVGTVDGQQVVSGSAKFLAESGIESAPRRPPSSLSASMASSLASSQSPTPSRPRRPRRFSC
jgi:Cu+-exporting ATPase